MTTPRSPLRGARDRGGGFTLIELLVALFIAAIMFAIGYGTIDQALANRGKIRRHQQQLVALQVAMSIMEQDFVQLAPRPVRQPLGDGWLPAIQTVASSESAAGSDSGSPGDSGDPASSASDSGPQPLVTLTRGGWSNPTGVERPELERVAYVFDHGTLIREHWNVLDATLEDQPVKRNLLKHLKSVTFRYLTLGHQWIGQWPPPEVSSGQVQDSYYRMRPIAVEVTLDTDDWGQIVRVFEVAG
jgi:general secretion pathway protein J